MTTQNDTHIACLKNPVCPCAKCAQMRKVVFGDMPREMQYDIDPAISGLLIKEGTWEPFLDTTKHDSRPTED